MSLICIVSIASQMWLLGRLLPLIIGKYVCSDDKHWRCYLQLLRIVTIGTRPFASNTGLSGDVQFSLPKYLHSKTALPYSFAPTNAAVSNSLINLWILYGPGLVPYAILLGKCFKNLPHTIAERHQNYMCLRLLSAPGSYSENW